MSYIGCLKKRSYPQNACEALQIITVLHRGGPANEYGVHDSGGSTQGISSLRI